MMINKLNIHFDTAEKDVDVLENSIIVLDNPVKNTLYSYPFSTDCVCTVIVKEGGLDCRIDMEQFHIDRKGLLVILTSQIVENLSFSKDFNGTLILFSQSFLDSLSIADAFGRLLSVKSSPFTPIEGEGFESLTNYARMLQNTLRQKDHPYQEEVARLLTRAFCLGLGYYLHPQKSVEKQRRAEEISSAFIELVKQNCLTERELAFYADRLCVSIKHLSAMVYKSTGKSPSKWIEDYTILKAKQFLCTTNETVLAISEVMSFKSQSDFGKYFKRHTGTSPADFRKKN